MANSIDGSNTLDHTAADAAPAPQIRELNSSRFITLTYINLTCAVALFAVFITPNHAARSRHGKISLAG